MTDLGDFIKRAVIQEETWAHHFDPESKLQSKQWKHSGSPPPNKFKRFHSVGKEVALIFRNSQWVIMIDSFE